MPAVVTSLDAAAVTAFDGAVITAFDVAVEERPFQGRVTRQEDDPGL